MWKVGRDAAEEILEKKRKYEEDRYKPTVNKMKDLLAVQKRLEETFDRLVYGDKREDKAANREKDIEAGVREGVGQIKEELKVAQQELFDYLMDKVFPSAMYEDYYEQKLYSDFVDKMGEEEKYAFMQRFPFAFSRKTIEKDPIIALMGVRYEDLWKEFDLPEEEMQQRYIEFAREQIDIQNRQDLEGVVNEWERKQGNYELLKTKLDKKLEGREGEIDKNE